MTNILKLEPNSICIMRLSAIGDVCHAVSCVQAIQRRYPQASISWVIGKLEYSLIKDLPNIDFIIFDKSLGIKAYSQLRQQMCGKTFDVLLHMQLAFRANLAAFFIPAKIKLGFSKARSKELHSLFVNHHIAQEKGFHVLDGFRDFARAIGVADCSPQWNIPVSDEALQWASSHLPDQPYMVISPAASKAERNWLTERYAAIADYCQQRGLQVLISGGPSEHEQRLAEQIIKLSSNQHPPLNLVGKTNLQQLLLLLKNAQFVLAPDSGPAHMAVTQQTPVIGLYAHSNPRRTGPYTYLKYCADAYTVSARKELAAQDEIPWGFRLKGDQLMQQISVQQVTKLIEQLLDQKAIDQKSHQ